MPTRIHKTGRCAHAARAVASANSVDNNFYEVKRHGIIQHCNSELSGADGPRGLASSLVAAKCYPGNSVSVSRCSYAYGRNILHGVL